MAHSSINFLDISYLRQGTTTQHEVYQLLHTGRIMEVLSAYNPVLVGTIPLDINIAGSDIDILCTYNNISTFKAHLLRLFKGENEFELQELELYGKLSVIANFTKQGYAFEIFGQDIPAISQMGYRHMIIEYHLLLKYGQPLKEEVIRLKKEGYKTEPAFCKYLGIEGNPYLELLKLEK